MNQAFNVYAPAYDTDFTFTPIGKLQREAVFRVLSPMLGPGVNVLEIGCGTGHDAFQIAPRVNRVDAWDPSEGMIAVCNGKLGRHRLSNVVFNRGDALDAAETAADHNLVFSDFGALNALSPDQLSEFASRCSLARKGTRLVFVVMGRRCLWERLYFTLKGSRRKAGRRMSSEAVDANVAGIAFPVWYYSPAELAGNFRMFSVTDIRPVGFLVPPGYMQTFFTSWPRTLKLLGFFDRMFSGWSMLADRADHYIITMVRR